MRVTVFGATGTIGQALVPALREHEVVAVSRSPQEPLEGVKWVTGDVTDAATVARALERADAAYYLVHSLGSPDFAARDRRAAETVRAEAERAGVRQLIYLGGLGDDSPDLSEHLKSRRETGEILAAGTVPVTTLRAAMVVGAGSAAFETILALVDRLPGMITPRWVTSETQPIALENIVAYLAGVLGREEALGRTFDVGGPDVMTYRRDDGANRPPAREAAADRRGAVPDSPAVVVLAPSRDAREGVRGPPAGRGATQSDGGARRLHPPSRAGGAHLVRRRGPSRPRRARAALSATR